jgi:hypothetical protein
MGVPSAEERRRIMDKAVAAGKAAYDAARAQGTEMSQALASSQAVTKAVAKSAAAAVKNPTPATSSGTPAATSSPVIGTETLLTVGGHTYSVPQSLSPIVQTVVGAPLAAEVASVQTVEPGDVQVDVSMSHLTKEEQLKAMSGAILLATAAEAYKDITGSEVQDMASFSRAVAASQRDLIRTIASGTASESQIANIVAGVPQYVAELFQPSPPSLPGDVYTPPAPAGGSEDIIPGIPNLPGDRVPAKRHRGRVGAATQPEASPRPRDHWASNGHLAGGGLTWRPTRK